MQFVKGPIFANVLLADEINRTPPKTQAALLEAMQEYQVTAGGVRYPLEEPFFVLATQNPIEMEGTYPLPEAQLDRFMFNVVIDYLPEEDEVAVVMQTTAGRPQPIEPLFTGEDVLRFHDVVRRVPIAEDLVRYAVRLAAASRPGQAEHAGLRQPMGKLGRRPAGGAVPRAGRQGPRLAQRPGARHLRRSAGPGPRRLPAPHPRQLPRRGRRRRRGDGRQSPAGDRQGAGSVADCNGTARSNRPSAPGTWSARAGRARPRPTRGRARRR